MTNQDFKNFLADFDQSISNLIDNDLEKFIKESFPPYTHIGKYYDPRDVSVRALFSDYISSGLYQYSFDPLISFEMKQLKYSQEILHPECNCYRRSKIKIRPIKTCSHRDRILYASWNFYLSNLHKKWLSTHGISNVVSAYIPNTGKFNANHAKKAFDYIQGRNEYSARALDIRSFFDKLDHKELKENLIDLIGNGGLLDTVNYKLYKAVTNYNYIELEDLRKHLSKFSGGKGMYFSRDRYNWELLRDLKLIKENYKQGIPQGLACSGVLANIAMMKIDLNMAEIAKKYNSIYLRYADDIFIASPNQTTVESLMNSCTDQLRLSNLPIAEEKTEIFDYKIGDKVHPELSYLGIKCKGNEVSVRMNGINKFYKETSQFIFSYVLTCRKRGITPSRKKIRAIFSHSGSQNYYSYLRRSSQVFEKDGRYKCKGIKGILKNHLSWIDNQFDLALDAKLSSKKDTFVASLECNCPLKKDG